MKYKFKKYDLAVMDHNPDATVWRVIDVNGVWADVVDAELQLKLADKGLKPRSHAVNTKYLKPLTYVQLNAWNACV
jgi:hypothetical protein